MAELYLKRVGMALWPEGDDSIAAFSKIPFGKSLKAEVKQPRNPRYHRWFFAICSRIAGGIGSDAETVANVFKFATGHVEIIKTKSYGEVKIPKSISFAQLDDLAFHEFVEKCIQTAYTEWQIDPADLADLLAPQEAHTAHRQGEIAQGGK